eukprot:Skav221843  [mRNA]  locus=scaffold126:111743:112354:+ [translate_table: standard]
MGNSAASQCPNCNGKGTVKQGAGAGGAVAGALVGGVLGGPLGLVLGGVVGANAEVNIQCSRCDGSGRVEMDKGSNSQAAAYTPSGWHDRGGKTMKMFHGTTATNAQSIMKNGFKPSSGGMLGPGVYVSADIEKAKKYGDSVLMVEAKLGKTKKIDSQSHPMRTSWSSEGYDSAWVPANCGMVHSGLTETCVFDSNRIRVVSSM